MTTNKRTNEEWRELITGQRAGGLTQAEWCAANGVNLYTFRDRSSRLNKLEKEKGQKSKQPKKDTTDQNNPKKKTAGWLEIKSGDLIAKTAEIRIEHGSFAVTVTPGFDSGMLTEVLRAVSRICC